MSLSLVALRLRPISPWHVGSAGHLLGPLDLLADGDLLLRVDLDSFVRRLGLAERALFESSLRAGDGLRQGHLFMAERLPMCRAGALPVGRLGPAVVDALAELRAGRQRVFRLAHAALQSGESSCLDGGHVRAALLAGLGGRAPVARARTASAPSPWAGVGFGPVRLIQGHSSARIALAGRIAPAAAQPLVVASREEWLEVHCPGDELVMEVRLQPARVARHSLPLDEAWRLQCEATRGAAGELTRQAQALRKMAARTPDGEAARFVQRAEAVLQAMEAQPLSLVRVGMGGGVPGGRRHADGRQRPGTVPAAVLSHPRAPGSSPGTDAVPLGWMQVEPVWG